MKATPLSPEGLTRKRFTLSGRSAILDPRTHAVRPDLADVRLADLVFAPHYAAPVPRTIGRVVPLRAERRTDGEVLATLQPGDEFELLDLVGNDAWGISTGQGLVGYVEAAALSAA